MHTDAVTRLIWFKLTTTISTHTHTHTCMPTHTGTHTHTHTHAHPHAHAHPRSHANLYVTDVTPSQLRRLHRGEKESSLFMKHVTWWKTGAAAWTRGMTNLQSPSLRRNEAHIVTSLPAQTWCEVNKGSQDGYTQEAVNSHLSILLPQVLVSLN